MGFGPYVAEVVASGSDVDTQIHLWDLHSGSQYATLRASGGNGPSGTRSGQGGLAIGHAPLSGTRPPMLAVVAQADRAMIYIYGFRKEQPLLKFVVPEKIVTIEVSNDGTLCAGGTVQGRLYVWEIVTGKLLRVIDAHYKAIRAIRWTNDDLAFVTGSEDSLVNVWNRDSLQDVGDGSSPVPYRSWNGHTLPVTDVVCGFGLVTTARVFSVSLDRTCKVWDIFTGNQIVTILFPKPLYTLAVDPTELRMYGGAGDGTIYQVDLFRRTEDAQKNVVVESLRTDRIEDFASTNGDKPTFVGHTGKINSLSLSLEGTHLVSASADGSVITWDTSSRMQLRVSRNHNGAPVTSAIVFRKPLELLELQPKPEDPAIVVRPFAKMVSPPLSMDEVLAKAKEALEGKMTMGEALPNRTLIYDEDEVSHQGVQSNFYRDLLKNVDSSLFQPEEGSAGVTNLFNIPKVLSAEEELQLLREQNAMLRKANDDLYQAAMHALVRVGKEEDEQDGGTSMRLD
ncbi:WD40-repeat-containing domain protein [Cladochytrium replicatum]|nr:WD40-repeat-containing domain protein [Cladochytrium replicatum]